MPRFLLVASFEFAIKLAIRQVLFLAIVFVAIACWIGQRQAWFLEVVLLTS